MNHLGRAQLRLATCAAERRGTLYCHPQIRGLQTFLRTLQERDVAKVECMLRSGPVTQVCWGEAKSGERILSESPSSWLEPCLVWSCAVPRSHFYPPKALKSYYDCPTPATQNGLQNVIRGWHDKYLAKASRSINFCSSWRSEVIPLNSFKFH